LSGTATRWISTLITLTDKVRGLLDSQQKTSAAITRMSEDIASLRLEVERLKAREEVLIARAEAAAQSAASAVAVHNTAELARRIGGLEARALSPPGDQQG
jgi:hypothetical protein